jgi:electron transport complex protein RnfG
MRGHCVAFLNEQMIRPMNDKRGSFLLVPLLTLGGALLLAIIYSVVAPRIADNRHQAADRLVLDALQFPNDTALAANGDVADESLLDLREPKQVWLARRDGQVLAIVLPLRAPDGYVAPIDLIVAITPEGKIGAVHALAHRETPGLGDAIDSDKSEWLNQFVGRSLESTPAAQWNSKNGGGDFDGITGATVTSRAVIDAVHNALLYFAQHRERLLQEQSSQPVSQETGHD